MRYFTSPKPDNGYLLWKLFDLYISYIVRGKFCVSLGPPVAPNKTRSLIPISVPLLLYNPGQYIKNGLYRSSCFIKNKELSNSILFYTFRFLIVPNINSSNSKRFYHDLLIYNTLRNNIYLITFSN